MIRVALILCLSVFLAACSPEYNWRQVSIGDGVVMAFFPDKPVTESRTLQFSGHDVEFGLTGAQVGDALFTVAYAPLPAEINSSDDLKQDFAKAVIGSLYRNLGMAEPDVLPPFGQVFSIDGKSPKGPVRLLAKVWLTDAALVEGVVMAEPDAFPAPEADQFLKDLEAAR